MQTKKPVQKNVNTTTLGLCPILNGIIIFKLFLSYCYADCSPHRPSPGSVLRFAVVDIFCVTSVTRRLLDTTTTIDLYCYTDFDYTVIAVCCNVLYKTHLIAYDVY